MSSLYRNGSLNVTGQPSEEEALALFECAARNLLRLSAAGFMAKYRRGEFERLHDDPRASAVAALIPAHMQLQSSSESL